MGLETIAILALTAASGAMSVASSIEQGKAAEAQGKFNAQVDRRNAIQQEADINVNKSIEDAARKETVMDAADAKRDILRQGRKAAAQKTAQSVRQGMAIGSPSLDAILMDQGLQEEMALNDITKQQGRITQASRGRTRAFTRDAFSVRAVGETNAQASIAAGKNAKRSHQMQAIGTGLSTLSSMGTTFAASRPPKSTSN